MILAWLCLIALGVSNVAHAQSCDERVKAEVANPGSTQYIVTLKKEDGKGRMFKLSFSKAVSTISSGEATFTKKLKKNTYLFKLTKNSLNQIKTANATDVRVQITFLQNETAPIVTALSLRKKICNEKPVKPKKSKCADKIQATDCNSYFMKKKKGSNVDSERGVMKFPTPGKLRSWKLEIGFSDEITNLQVVSPIPEGNDCNKLFRFRNPAQTKGKGRKKMSLKYHMHYSRDLAERPKVSYIFFGNEVCNQTCGTIPVCPPPTTEAPTTQPPEVTTAAPEVTTEAPPEVTTEEATTTEEPEEVTTTETPEEVTTEEPGPPLDEITFNDVFHS